MSDVEQPPPPTANDGDEDHYPRAFGPFQLIGLLGRGGMGEVYVAQREGIAGIAKRCVVKTLRPGFSDDREYVTRFLDEARIVVQLHHKNICPVYDVGKVGLRHYLAMEYIAGRDLRLVATKAQQSGRMHPGLAMHIIGEMLEALDYAHRLVDPVTDEALMLVHRDISPHNVMVGFEGDVRLIDFGLAASTLKLEHTAPNVVMGKVAYMAPEHVCGETLDARADQFSAAVTAYELFVGERFYESRDAREVYQLAAQGNFRPAKFAALPDGLKQALDRALSSHKVDRFGSCGEFREALEQFRFKSGLRGDAPALRTLMHTLFKEELLVEKAMLSRAGSASVPVATADKTASSPSASKDIEDSTHATASTPSARVDAQPTEIVTRAPPPPKKTARPVRFIAAGVVVVAVAVVAVVARVAQPADVAVDAGVVVAVSPPAPPPPPPPSRAPPTTPATEAAQPPSTASSAPSTPPTPATPPTAPSPRSTPQPRSQRGPHSTKPPAPAPPPAVTTTPVEPPPPPPPVKSAPPKPAADAPVSVRVDYLARECPKAACTAPLKKHRDDYPTLPGRELPNFIAALKACFAQCNN